MNHPNPDFGIDAPSAASSDEEKRLYDLQTTILDVLPLWSFSDWKALMEKLQHYTAAVQAEEARRKYAKGWHDALEEASRSLEELARR